ncbi:MAG: hypothetical protein IPJ99_15015 [Betaproteobacteria bacterium]|nr:hypothetical protein [Betaproteobacteria bacterium]
MFSFLFTPAPTPTATQTPGTDPTQSPNADTTTLFDNGVWSITGLGNVNTASGNIAYGNNTLTDGLRPGAFDLTTEILGAQLAETFRTNPDLAHSVVWNPDVLAVATNILATGVYQCFPTDPLVLDLNGDGVKLTAFGESPVLFDIDHDASGSQEITGWVSPEDGIVVMDLNGSGTIDGIHETLSEYFNGTPGTLGEAGSTPTPTASRPSKPSTATPTINSPPPTPPGTPSKSGRTPTTTASPTPANSRP